MRSAATLPRLLAGLAALLAGCGASEPPPLEHPVVLIGIDGLDPGVAADLLEAGRMPNLARFAEHGVVGSLATLSPTYSPVIWTTIATGQPAEQHGIDDFLDAETQMPFTSNCRKVPALWNLVSDAGRSVDVAGWWVSWPAEPVNGRVLSSYAAAVQAKLIWKGAVWEDLEDQTWPPAFAGEIADRIVFASRPEELLPRLRRAFPIPDHWNDLTRRLVNDLAWTYAGDLSFEAVAESMLEHEPGDLVMVYLALPDVAGHRFWRYHRPEDFSYEVPEPDRSDYADFLNLAYVEVDRLVGRLLERAPEDANVILLSDHGMHADVDEKTRDDPESLQSGHHQLAPPGLFAAMGPTVKHQGNLLREGERSLLGHVLGVAPLVLRLLDLAVPENWPLGRQGNTLERVLGDTWRLEHPVRLGPNPEPGFRAATPPRVPIANVDEAFKRDLAAMGYVEIVGEDSGGSGVSGG